MSELMAPELLNRRVLVLVGGYGAGKTQIAINMALRIAKQKERVAIVDLDLINPYFRSRELAESLEEQGVEAVRPEGDIAYSESPSLGPEIDSALLDTSKRVILDAGGDEAGATILGRYSPLLQGDDVAVIQIVNVFRPFSSTVAEIQKLRRELEGKSRLKIHGLFNNSNLQEWTELADWYRAGEVIQQCASESGIPLVGTGVNPAWARQVGLAWNPGWLPVERYLSLGWKTGPIG